jgi:site-specific recombinase XerC
MSILERRTTPLRKYHPNNERVKREYLTFLEQAKRMSPSTVDQVAASLALFEQSTGYRDFRKFHRQQAIAFKERMQRAVNPATGKGLAKATIHSRLMSMKSFIHWLQGRPGFRSCITYDDAEYFNPSANDERVAKAVRERAVPTLEQIKSVVEAMPVATIVQRRDRALVSGAILSGARDNALASLSLRHVDLANRTVFQDARTVRTKNAKTFTSGFFPVDQLFEDVVATWVRELESIGFGPDDPVFPASDVQVGAERRFEVVGVSRAFWKNAPCHPPHL